MVIELSLGFDVEVYEDGTFELPQRHWTTTQLKKVSREISRALRTNIIDDRIGDLLDERTE